MTSTAEHKGAGAAPDMQGDLMARRGWLARLFEPRRLGSMAPATKLLTYCALVFWAIIVLFPLYWILITSVKLPIQVNDGPDYLPFIDFQPSLHAWKYLFIDVASDTFRPYLNSVIIAPTSTILAVIVGALAAYALSRIEFKPKFGSIVLFVVVMLATTAIVAFYGVDWRLAVAVAVGVFLLLVRAFSRHFKRKIGNRDILFWIISQRILPPIVTVLPIYVMFVRLHLQDTHIALILTYMTVNLPIVVWLMHDFFKSIPLDLEESAQLDGASRIRIFWELILPLAKPGLAATTLLVLILAWNEYLLALFLSTSNAQTMPLLVAAQNATRGPQWWYMSALIIIMIAPVIVIAIALQRLIGRGLLLGAVKG